MIGVLLAGQSLAYYMANLADSCCEVPHADTHMWSVAAGAFITPTGNGLTAYLNRLRALTGGPVYAIVYAPGGTALLPLDDSGNGHWLGSIDAACIAVAQTALATVSGLQLNRIEWWQGQQDCFALGYSDMYNSYKNGLGSLLATFRTGLGNGFRFCIWPVGRLPTGQSQQVVRAQMVFSTTTAGVEPGPSSHDLLLLDGTHLQPQASAEMGRRGAENAYSSLNSPTELHGGAGPRIVQLSRSGNNLFVDVALRNGAFLRPTALTTNWVLFEASTFASSALCAGTAYGKTITLTGYAPIPVARIGHAAAQNYGGIDVYDSDGQVCLPLTPEMLVSS